MLSQTIKKINIVLCEKLILKVITLSDDMHEGVAKMKQDFFLFTAQVDFEQEPVISFKQEAHGDTSLT